MLRIGTTTGVDVRAVGERTRFEACRAARRRGVLISPLSDVVVLMPPLGISFEDLDELLDVVRASIEETVL